MVAYIATLVRALLLTAALVFVAQPAEAARRTAEHTTTAQTADHPKAAAQDDDGASLDGVLIIVGVVGILVFVAWVGSRVGDHGTHVIG